MTLCHKELPYFFLTCNKDTEMYKAELIPQGISCSELSNNCHFYIDDDWLIVLVYNLSFSIIIIIVHIGSFSIHLETETERETN